MTTTGAGTLTECPIAGVHEHAFRGPHRFREWDPVVPLHGEIERLLIGMVRTSYPMDRSQYERGWNEALHAARKKIDALRPRPQGGQPWLTPTPSDPAAPLDVERLAFAIAAAEGGDGWTPWGSERTNAHLIADKYAGLNVHTHHPDCAFCNPSLLAAIFVPDPVAELLVREQDFTPSAPAAPLDVERLAQALWSEEVQRLYGKTVAWSVLSALSRSQRIEAAGVIAAEYAAAEEPKPEPVCDHAWTTMDGPTFCAKCGRESGR